MMPDFNFPEGATPIDPDEAEGLLPTLENILKSKRFTWGSKKELTKAGETRSSYIAALREADKGSYEPLLEFVRS